MKDLFCFAQKIHTNIDVACDTPLFGAMGYLDWREIWRWRTKCFLPIDQPFGAHYHVYLLLPGGIGSFRTKIFVVEALFDHGPDGKFTNYSHQDYIIILLVHTITILHCLFIQ